jgi:hypothetical protein
VENDELNFMKVAYARAVETKVNGLRKQSLPGAERRGNLLRLLRFVRHDAAFYDNLFKPFTIDAHARLVPTRASFLCPRAGTTDLNSK